MSDNGEQQAVSDKVLNAFVDFYLAKQQNEELDQISQWDDHYVMASINEVLQLSSYFNHEDKKAALIREKRAELEELINTLIDQHGAPNSSDEAQWLDWYQQHLDSLYSGGRKGE